MHTGTMHEQACANASDWRDALTVTEWHSLLYVRREDAH